MPSGAQGSADTEDALAEKPISWYRAIQEDNQEAAKKAIQIELSELIEKHGLKNYLILFLYDDVDSISDYHSDQLYAAASAAENGKRDILLVLHSSGGSIEPAYLISKTLKRLSAKKFVVAVPRRAKSAATLISLGADEIHMGMTSQLGPIDPQMGGLPVLALQNALECIAEVACRYPASSEMFTKYLVDQVPIRILGHLKRVGESAVQYAERLLAGKKVGDNKTPEQVANHLVNYYKDHGFVIDSDEAKKLLGSAIVKEGTAEYAVSNEIFQLFDLIGWCYKRKNRSFWYVGALDGGHGTREIKTNS